jgi:methyl coenzyme M reductase subunit D
VYTINVFEASGRETPKTDYYGVHRGQPPKKPMIVEGSSIQVTVQAGKIIKDYADLNELYDISQPGKYTIQVERTDPTTRSVVKSNSIVVTVTS